MKEIIEDDKSRKMTIAVANWLCEALEIIACNDADITLSEELDSWLQKQKYN